MEQKTITLADSAARLPPPKLEYFDWDKVVEKFFSDFKPPAKMPVTTRSLARLGDALIRLGRSFGGQVEE